MWKAKINGLKNSMHWVKPPKFYPTALHEMTMDLNSLSVDIAGRCTVLRSDVHDVLMAMIDNILTQLKGKLYLYETARSGKRWVLFQTCV